EKDLALKEAERAMMLSSSAKDRLNEPTTEEVLALIQTIFGESSRPISTLARLLQTPYGGGWLYITPVTPALLRLDPFSDPLRDRAVSKSRGGRSLNQNQHRRWRGVGLLHQPRSTGALCHGIEPGAQGSSTVAAAHGHP